MPDFLHEYQRLTQLYREMGDEELLQLARQVDDLTEPAQEVLRTEMSSRRLVIPHENALEVSSERESRFTELGRFASLSASECVWEFAESAEAQAAAEMLTDAGIHCDVTLPRLENLDMGAPKVAVLPVDVERARQLLSQPIPEEFRTLVRTQDQFVLPTCPKCGSVDPLLESIEPKNKWQCEGCGNVWSDVLSS